MRNRAVWMKRILQSVTCVALVLPVFMMLTHTEAVTREELPYEPDSLLVKASVQFGGLMAMSYKAQDFSRYGDAELLLALTNGPESGLRTYMDRGEQTCWYALTIPEGQDLDETKSALEQETGVIAVTYNFLISPVDDVEEPFVPEIQATEATYESQQWHLQSSGLPEAETYLSENGFSSGGSDQVIVAVLDTGVDYNHPDLTDNILRTADGNIVGEDTTRDTTSDPLPDSDQANSAHGTHCAGIIAASGTTYVRGVASNVKIMPVKVLSKAGGSVESFLKGILFAYNNGAKIVSMSIGIDVTEIAEYEEINGQQVQVTTPLSLWNAASNISALHDAIREYDDEMIFIAAAGNNARPNEDVGDIRYLRTYPAAWPEVIGVMSIDQTPQLNGDWLSGFSNWDVEPGGEPEYDIAAPGSLIVSTMPTGSYYGTMSGTSMATPFVSGCAALLLTKYIDNNDFSIQDVKRILLENAEIKQGITVDGTVYFYPSVRIDQALAYREPVSVELPAYTYVQQGNGTSLDTPLVPEQNGHKLTYYYESDTYRGNVAPTKPGAYRVKAEIDSIYYAGEAQGVYTVYQNTGDFNGDGTVDREDVEIYSRHQFGSANGSGVISDRYVAALDYNQDGEINLLDFGWMCMLEKRLAQNDK